MCLLLESAENRTKENKQEASENKVSKKKIYEAIYTI